ncbi:hypothetical protein SUGI_1135310 [Cryptomeria japonica]|nr:hypothetical protein SUGI_1135310 [Cryptomeria japonica]
MNYKEHKDAVEKCKICRKGIVLNTTRNSIKGIFVTEDLECGDRVHSDIVDFDKNEQRQYPRVSYGVNHSEIFVNGPAAT